MKVVKISEFQSSRSSASAQISFALKGVVRVNKKAFLLLAPDLKEDQDAYLHLAYEGEKEDHKLFVWLNSDPQEGLKLRHKKGTLRKENDQMVCNAAALIKHFTELFDWPLNPQKKTTIRYEFEPQIIKNEFSDRIFQLS